MNKRTTLVVLIRVFSTERDNFCKFSQRRIKFFLARASLVPWFRYFRSKIQMNVHPGTKKPRCDESAGLFFFTRTTDTGQSVRWQWFRRAFAGLPSRQTRPTHVRVRSRARVCGSERSHETFMPIPPRVTPLNPRLSKTRCSRDRSRCIFDMTVSHLVCVIRWLYVFRKLSPNFPK